MMRRGFRWIVIGALLIQGGGALAQNSLDTLEEELKEAKQQHQDVTSQIVTNFFTQVDAGMGSTDAAVALYQQAGGALPDPSPVVTQNEDETASEKDARLALDQANLTKLGVALQLHCGLLHYGALFVLKPDQKGLQDDWVAWLKTAAQIYPQLAQPAASSAPPRSPEPQKKKRDRGDAAQAPKSPYFPADMKQKALQDSVISKFLTFNAWDGKDQGQWAVQDIPKLYRKNVLEPLRVSPTAETLAAWDAYIAMANADEPDNTKWTQVDYPPLQFDRACDDYAVAPDTEKLEGLVNMIKANPTYPKVDDWIARVHQLLADYRAAHGGPPATPQKVTTDAATPTPTTDPNVTVTTQQQGDMTVITTHTNSAPVNPAQ